MAGYGKRPKKSMPKARGGKPTPNPQRSAKKKRVRKAARGGY